MKLGNAASQGDLAVVKDCLSEGLDVDVWIMMPVNNREVEFLELGPITSSVCSTTYLN